MGIICLRNKARIIDKRRKKRRRAWRKESVIMSSSGLKVFFIWEVSGRRDGIA